MLASSIRTNQQYGGLVEACGDRPGDRDVPGDGVPRRKLPLLRIPLPRLGRCILNPWGFLANLIWSAAIYAIALWARLPPQRVQEQITETAIETAEEERELERSSTSGVRSGPGHCGRSSEQNRKRPGRSPENCCRRESLVASRHRMRGCGYPRTGTGRRPEPRRRCSAGQ